jgi:type I restriction enzyme S subunit
MPRHLSGAQPPNVRKPGVQGDARFLPTGDSHGPVMAEQTELPEDWMSVRLGELLREMDVRESDLPKTEAEVLEVLSLTKNDGLILQSVRFGKRIATDDTSRYKVVREGQIVYNPYVIWEGAVHALHKHRAGLVSPVYPVWETVEPDGGFVDFLLRTPPLIDAYNRVCSGAVNRRRSIRAEAFSAIKVTVPPLREQRAIAEVLRTVQRAKEATEKVIAATRQLKASLMKHIFTYGPIPMSRAESSKSMDISSGPQHWRSIKLRELMSEGPQNGLYKPQSDYGDGTLIVRIDDYPNEGGVVTGAARRVMLTGDEERLYCLHPGDLLVNRVNSLSHLGKTALIGEPEEPVVYESNMMRFSVEGRNALPEYLYRFLCFEPTREAMRGMAKRAVAQSSINQGDVSSLIVPLPPSGEQRQIVSQLRAVDAKLAAEEKRRAALDAFFKSLLDHLMTGKLRVIDIEAQHEA